MTDNTSQLTASAAEDYYMEIMSSPEMGKSTLAPTLQFTTTISPNYKGLGYLFVREIRSNSSGSLIYLRFMLVPQKREDSQNKCLGRMSYADFSGLEDVLDEALSEYRRKNFKKMSHKQRHMEVARGD